VNKAYAEVLASKRELNNADCDLKNDYPTGLFFMFDEFYKSSVSIERSNGTQPGEQPTCKFELDDLGDFIMSPGAIGPDPYYLAVFYEKGLQSSMKINRMCFGGENSVSFEVKSVNKPKPPNWEGTGDGYFTTNSWEKWHYDDYDWNYEDGSNT